MGRGRGSRSGSVSISVSVRVKVNVRVMVKGEFDPRAMRVDVDRSSASTIITF